MIKELIFKVFNYSGSSNGYQNEIRNNFTNYGWFDRDKFLLELN